MDKPDTPEAAPSQRPDPTKYYPKAQGHDLPGDARTDEEKLAASLKETARRKGRRSKWWQARA